MVVVLLTDYSRFPFASFALRAARRAFPVSVDTGNG